MATYRITRLITRDKIPIIAVPRELFVQRWATYESTELSNENQHISLNGSHTNFIMRSLAYLWECDWCVSIWVGSGISTATYYLENTWWWQIILLAATASSITGLIAQREPD